MQRRHIDYARYNAQRISHTVKQRYLKGGLLKRPLWMDVVDALPPVATPTRLRAHDPSNYTETGSTAKPDAVDGAMEELDQWRLQQVSAYCHGLGTFKWFKLHKSSGRYGTMPTTAGGKPARRRHGHSDKAWRQAVTEADTVYAFPRDIVYPEDRLRARFYADHPLEQFRPRSLQEERAREEVEQAQKKSMKAVLQSLFPQTAASATNSPASSSSSSPPDLPDGESVVAYQLRLMREQKMSEADAYAAACSAFYRGKADALLKQAAEIKREEAAATVKESESEKESAASDEEPIATTTSTTTVKKVETAADAWLKMEEEAFARGCALKHQEDVNRQLQRISRQQSTAI